MDLQEIEQRMLEAMDDGQPWHRADELAGRLRLTYHGASSTLARLRRQGLIVHRWSGVSDPGWYGLTPLGQVEARRGGQLRLA